MSDNIGFAAENDVVSRTQFRMHSIRKKFILSYIESKFRIYISWIINVLDCVFVVNCGSFDSYHILVNGY